MTSLNPASQPFFPSGPAVRRDSAALLVAGGDGAYQVVGGAGAAQKTPPSSALEAPLADNVNATILSARSGTPSSLSGVPTTSEESSLRLGATKPERHDRVASSLSNYQSARGSPSPPNTFHTSPTEVQDMAGASQFLRQPPLTTSSPPESLGSRSTSVSRDDDGPLSSSSVQQPHQHRREAGGMVAVANADEGSADSPHPLSRSAFSDRSSFPAIESFLRREGRVAAPAAPYLTGANGGDLASITPGSGDQANKWEDVPPQGYLGPAPAGLGNGNGPQPAVGGFSRVPGSRSSTFGPIGKPAIGVNDLAPPIAPHQLIGAQGNSQPGAIPRSMSLSLPVNPPIQPAGPVRKSSFAAFDNTFTAASPAAPQPPPSKSPLPSSFLNYTIGGSTNNQPSANTTPTSGPFTASHGGTSLSASVGPYSNATGTENMSSSPSSVRSIGNMSELASNPFDAQAKASPFINDLLDRLIRCEYSTSNIQREIGDINRKMNILLDSLVGGGVHRPDVNGDSHSTSPIAGNTVTPTAGTPGINATARLGDNGLYSFKNASSTSSLLLGSPAAPGGPRDRDRERDEEIRQLNVRISTLNTSVTQLLQAQSQAQIQNMNAGLGGASPAVLGSGFNGNAGMGMGMGTPNLSGTPDLPQTPMGGIGGRGADMGLGNRPSPRAPIPVRTWSSGSLDVGPALAAGAAGRGGVGPGLLQDKRRSIISLGRRDSTGVCAMFKLARVVH